MSKGSMEQMGHAKFYRELCHELNQGFGQFERSVATRLEVTFGL